MDLPGETAHILTEFLMKAIIEHNLSSKVICYCADNARVNMGGTKQQGDQNVSSFMLLSLSSVTAITNAVDSCLVALQIADVDDSLITDTSNHKFTKFHIGAKNKEYFEQHGRYKAN
ncbi:hypothetical protein BLOT_009295 [Blomia tropicalis]|nr:hypothetical protein BLOT_009295 [Blomia tropicalis]